MQELSDEPPEHVPQSLQGKIAVDPRLTRKAVSYQGNRELPGFRWFKFKEGFSTTLVEDLLSASGGADVLDPFCGSGTAILTAYRMGKRSTGIDIMPIGGVVVDAVSAVSNGASSASIRAAADDVIKHLEDGTKEDAFKHLRITKNAFPLQTEKELAGARYAVKNARNSRVAKILEFACMSVLEQVSYTRKDGQFLRWDPRSGRGAAGRLNKGKLPTFREAFAEKIKDILSDMAHLKSAYRGPRPIVKTASSLLVLRGMKESSIDAVVTSPPYANRYDYTRTYALELAWLGYGERELSVLRQSMLTATVENRPKNEMLRGAYGNAKILAEACRMADKSAALQKVLQYLKSSRRNLNNPSIIRLVENYFAEMALVILELGRIVRKGGDVFIVNDNVRYHGMSVPVDIILSQFAERAGFQCESISVLPRGKGNSSQQMSRFGRVELRKCIYRWKKQ